MNILKNKNCNIKINDEEIPVVEEWRYIKAIADRDKLQDRIDKAIEYIENNKIYTNEKQEAYTLKNTWYGIELLEILDKGSDKE